MEKIYEVELKFRLGDTDHVEAILRQLGAAERAIVSHVDRYFNHPARDFRVTDEAFRIRSVDDMNCVTYKGAVLGEVAKTRHEIEIGITNGTEAAQQFFEMLTLLGFRFVREVRKSRRTFALDWKGSEFELAIDEVPGIGCFLEVELLTDVHRRAAAEKTVWELAHELGLSIAEPRSYLDLLLRSDGHCE